MSGLETLNNDQVLVYPNPANTSFSATINSAVAGKGNITVSDVAGRVLIAKPVAVQKGTQTIAVDVNSLTPGTYFVTYSGNGNAETQKLVIMK